MADPSSDLVLKRRGRVVAAHDLEGVPRGTPGRIMYVAGFSWKRARVRFDNGVERSGLDGRHLMSQSAWDELEHQRALEEARAEQARLADELRSRLIAEGTHQ